MKTATVQIAHRTMGTIALKVDAEDKHLFAERKAHLKLDNTKTASPKIAFSSNEGLEYASRAILAEHNKLHFAKNVFYKNGNSYDLTKKNLYQKAV